MENPVSQSSLSDLIAPYSVSYFTEVFCEWLEDAHRSARELQPLRRDEQRGGWANATSFGTDRYQYLLRTADSLSYFLDELTLVKGVQALLFRLPRAGLYVFRVEEGPHGRIRHTGNLRKELLADDSAVNEGADLAILAFLSVKHTVLGDDRELLLLPWAGTEEEGLTELWAGQGATKGRSDVITWDWLFPLYQRDGQGNGRADGHGGFHPGPTGPQSDLSSGTSAFDQPEPELPLRPKQDPTREAGGSSA